MSDIAPSSAPAENTAATTDTSTPATPGDGGAAPAPAGGAEAPSLHPAWAKTLDEAGIPDMLRPKLIEQIQRSERESQAAIEQARAGSIDPTWKQFVDSAAGAGATPEALVGAYNAAQAIQADPIAFHAQLTQQIDQLVEAGVLTRAQANEQKQTVDDAVASALDGDDPIQKELAELKQWRAQQEANAQRQQTEAQQRAAQEEAQQYAAEFHTQLRTQLAAAAGMTEQDFGTDDNARQFYQTVGRLAESVLANDPTDQITPQQAVQQALGALGPLVEANKRQTAPAQQQTPGIPAFSAAAGSAAVPAPAAQKFANDDQRIQAMLAEAARQQGLA